VSCTNAADCTAEDFNDQPMYATESGGIWGAATEITAPEGHDGSFHGVSCTDPGDCTAVGGDYSVYGQPFFATESGGAWGAASEVTAPGGAGLFYGVSCTDPGDCTAVGEDSDGQPMYATESGGIWGAASEVTAPGGAGLFYGVSCTDPGDCTAVGEDSDGQPMYATESGGIWGVASEVTAPGGGGYFRGVSCTAPGDCTAVGYAYTTGHPHRPMYATESAGAWGPATEINASPGGHGGFFSGVSCADTGDCTAVGGDSNGQPMYATKSGGTWRTPREMTVSSGGHDVSQVSCTNTADCTAVGFDGGEPPHQPMYVTESIPPRRTVSAVSPKTGPTTGGTPVTVTGTGFVAGSLVEIGQGTGPGPTAVAATNVDVVSPTVITATTAGSVLTGTFRVWVLTPGGTNNGAHYTYKN
jgi:hypothetical protein